MGRQQMPPVMIAPGLLANDTVCYPANMVTTNGVWVNENPLDFALPLFIFQTLMIVITTRLLILLLKPLNQPRVFCELIAGIILGPSVLGQINGFGTIFFPKQSLILFETIANMGAIYFVFILGLEMDLSVIKKHATKALAFAFAGMLLPFLIGCAFALVFFHQKTRIMQENTFIILFSVALSVTSFPVLSRILRELRLVDMEIGKVAKVAALFNDSFGMALLAYAASLAEMPESSGKTSFFVIVSCIVFVGFCILVVRPAIGWLIRRTPEEENMSDLTTSIIISGVMFSGVIADGIGVHPVFGAFIFGLVVPNGHLSVSLVEKLEEFVTGFLLPLFFVSSGLKTNVFKIQGFSDWVTLLFAIVLSFVGKVAGTVLPALFFKMPRDDGVALGLLMNSKGLLSLITLNFGKDQKVIDDTSYAIMMVAAIFTNAFITPVLVKIYRPARKFVPYKRRTIEKTKVDSEFRILACIHTPRNVPTMINLLEASHANKKSPISVFSLHLVELTGHSSSTVVVHGSHQKSEMLAINRMQAQSDHIINAFETFGKQTHAVSVQSLTAMSPYSTMHEEICNLAEDRRVALIILPFHKQQMVDGGMEAANPKFRMVNQNVLANAPCSVGILVDRGLSGSNRLGGATQMVSHSISVLFFGGPDDREGLSYAVRMSEIPGNRLSVIRFLPGPEAVDQSTMDENKEHSILTFQIDRERDKQIDDDYIKEFRMMKANDESFSYVEKVVNNGEETVAAIRSVDNHHDLLIVGRGEGTVSPLTSGLTEWSECPELGVIGDLLASADFAATVSVLVVQQYVGVGPNDDGTGTPDSASQQEEQAMMDSMRHC